MSVKITAARLFSLIAMMFCVSSWSQETPPYELERLSWRGEITTDQKVVIKNPYGNVTIKQNSQPELVVHAVMQKIGESPKVGSLEKDLGDKILSFDFVYPKGEEPAEPREGRIDVAVLLPEDVDVDIQVETGELSTKTLANNITAKSDGANLTVASSGQMDLYSRSGTISATVKNKKPAVHKIKTSTGNIDLFWGRDLPINLNMISGASITTNSLELLQSKGKDGRATTMATDSTIPVSTLFSDSGHLRIVVQ